MIFSGLAGAGVTMAAAGQGGSSVKGIGSAMAAFPHANRPIGETGTHVSEFVPGGLIPENVARLRLNLAGEVERERGEIAPMLK